MIVLLFSSGCSMKKYPFQQEESNISSIEIVSLEYYSARTETPEEVIITKIKNTPEFLSDFANIKIDLVSPPSRNPGTTPTCIRITYNDGVYEDISPHGTIVNRNGSNIYYGSKYLDEKQFSDLLVKYLGDSPIETEYIFYDHESEISTIEIVEFGEYDEKEDVLQIQNVICKIEDNAKFLKDFSEVGCFLNLNLPTRVSNNTKAIKINYFGGHWELIDAFGQSKFENYTYAYEGYRYFDKTQFASLIDMYINK